MAAEAAKRVDRRGGARPGAGRKPKTDDPSDPYTVLAKARAKHEAYKANLAEQEFKKRAGDLLDRARVEQASATVLAAVAQTLRSIPDNLERAVGLTPEQAEECERIIDSLCLSLHDKLRELGGW